MEISDKITLIRACLMLSQKEFAETLNFSQSYIGDIESGRSKPSNNVLNAISDNFSIQKEWLTSNNEILNIIDEMKFTRIPRIVYYFAFTKHGLDVVQVELNELFENRNTLQIDAKGIRTIDEFLRILLNKEGSSAKLKKNLKDIIKNEGPLFIIKNISLSKIRNSVQFIERLFEEVQNDWHFKLYTKEGSKKPGLYFTLPLSSIIVVDYPSYFERNIDLIRSYTLPIQAPRWADLF